MNAVSDVSGVTGADQVENWFLLVDTSWQPQVENDSPPVEAVVGLWPVEEGGRLGKFWANPGYEPVDENSPSDPLDAGFRLVMAGEVGTEHLQLLLREVLFDMACDDDGHPLVTRSPQGRLCVVVTTSEVHRSRITASVWRRLSLTDLVEVLDGLEVLGAGADGDVDVFFNPGGPAGVCLDGGFVRDTALMDEDLVDQLSAGLVADTDELRVVPVDLTSESAGR